MANTAVVDDLNLARPKFKGFSKTTQSQYLVSVLGESDCPVRVD